MADMTSVSAKRVISAPIDQVWEVFTDIPDAANRIEGIDSVEMLSEGPFSVGTRWRETRTMMGRAATEEMWVTKADGPHQYQVEAESNGAHYVTRYDFREVDGGTEVTYVFAADTLTTSAKVMSALTGWMIKGSVKKMMQADIDNLADVLEIQNP